ncbi:aldehyde dehydrogenase family protein [Paracoccus sp. (in: a-proteobacteria)]|uniref:aldehyde dehydrogenase family protein n=1 Tax=Paracoccus sp. TaxID=267 RepID=UPI00272CC3E4|nr:aldehyde dehydrogenase family protein [Paracoccus sp. (in: a-proteobacteria)]
MTGWAARAAALYDGSPRRMLIDGQWRDALSGEVIEARDPADRRLLATIPKGGAADIDAAVTAARRAFEGPWSRFTPFERQALLLRIAERVEAEWQDLCLSDTLDMGMPIQRSLANSRRVLGMLRFYAGQAVAIHGQTIANSFPGEIVSMTVREPLGVVGAIIPWNAPIAGSVWKIAPALATGCTVVLKPSEEASLTVLMLARIMQECGLPDGVLNVVTGLGADAGAALAAHPGIDRIAFTGSTETGRAIARAAGGNIKRVSLELGGKSPVILCRDADLDRAIPVAAMAVFANSGQICIAGSRLFVAREIEDEVLSRLADHARGLRLGHGIDPEVDLGPLISARQAARVEGFLDRGRDEGARLLTGGARATPSGLAGHFVQPTVFAGVSDDMAIARDEIFGPVLSVLPFDDVDEALRRANATPYGLAAGIFTRDLGTAHKLARRLRAGTVWVNMYHAIDPAIPFGGVRMSGHGREGGTEHLDEFLDTKAIWINTD